MPIFEPPYHVNWEFKGTDTWNTKGLEMSREERRAYQVGYTDGYTTGHREGVDSVIYGDVSGLIGVGYTAGENMGPARGPLPRHRRRNAFGGPSGGGFGVAGVVSQALPHQFAQEMDEIKGKGRKYD